MIGIGITTYNRQENLQKTLEAIENFTHTPHFVVVADDGSHDNTKDLLYKRHEIAITGVNRGVAWNKNRCLYYLYEFTDVETIILLEDDCYPTQVGWETNWIAATKRFGHANLAGSWFSHFFEAGGSGTAEDPFTSTKWSGQCTSFSRQAIQDVGFMDTRFGRYGFEHAEHTERMIKAGYGGLRRDQDRYHVYLISSPELTVECLDAPIDHDALAKNAIVYAMLKGEDVYRYPWIDEKERELLLGELVTARNVPEHALERITEKLRQE